MSLTSAAASRASLVAVVGPVEPRLLDAFLTHYLKLGIERFFVAFHFPEDTADVVRTSLRETCQNLVGDPLITSVGPWHLHTNPNLIAELRNAAGKGWHLLADVDEFQSYPLSVDSTIARADAAGEGVVQGLMLDRVTNDGSITTWPPNVDIDTAYPLGALFTHIVLDGDPRKIVLAHSRANVVNGNHWSRGRHAMNGPIIPVHHFKWRDGVVSYLRKRVAMLESGKWHESSPAPRLEASRFLSHYDAFGGRIDVENPDLNFRPVSLGTLPTGWERESRMAVEAWYARVHSRRPEWVVRAVMDAASYMRRI